MVRQWLIELRSNTEKTQDFMADRVGISRQYYGMIESGVRKPSVELAKKIGKVLNFDWTIFFEEKRNKTFL